MYVLICTRQLTPIVVPVICNEEPVNMMLKTSKTGYGPVPHQGLCHPGRDPVLEFPSRSLTVPGHHPESEALTGTPAPTALVVNVFLQRSP
jgi:hypothetical protein